MHVGMTRECTHQLKYYKQEIHIQPNFTSLTCTFGVNMLYCHSVLSTDTILDVQHFHLIACAVPLCYVMPHF